MSTVKDVAAQESSIAGSERCCASGEPSTHKHSPKAKQYKLQGLMLIGNPYNSLQCTSHSRQDNVRNTLV